MKKYVIQYTNNNKKSEHKMNIKILHILYRIGFFFYSNGPLTQSYCTAKLEMPLSEKFWFYQLAHFLNQIWKSSENPLSTTP